MLPSLVCFLALGGGAAQSYPAWSAEVVADQPWPRSEGTRLTPAELASLADASPRPPFRTLTVGLRLPAGSLWVGSRDGLLYREGPNARWRVFHSRRWLPDDHVLDLAVAPSGEVSVRTAGGVVRLRRREMTLAKKMEAIEAELRRRHVREGLVGRVVLKKPGRVEDGWTQPDDDNDGLWTSMYVAAEAFRYGATGDPQARENAWKSLQALMFLEQVSGIPGFAARSIVPGTQPRPADGQWYRSADGRWWWKGDTSSDELDGHFFAHAVYFDLAATDAQKEAIRRVVGRIADHILDHKYYYVGPEGKRTTWGVWAPERLNRELEWVAERGLNSLEILSHLKVADHVVGKPRYAEAARDLVERHGYALNTVWQKSVWPIEVNHSDDELAFLAYYPLLRYERDPALRAIYKASLERSWLIERPEHSPLFNFIYAAGLQADRWTEPSRRPPEAGVPGKDYDQALCLEWFREVPEDLVEWTVKNSGRQDLGEVRVNRENQASSTWVLPVSERALMRWNGDPYQLDGGSGGASREDGTFILLPYWMGVYHRLLE